VSEYEISCRGLTELTTDYLEGAMSDRVRTTFEQHAVLCDPCSVHLDQIRITVRILARLASPDRAAAAALLAEVEPAGG
jgi:hypothetical protein